MGGVPRRRLIGTGGGTATKWSGDARRSMKGEEDEEIEERKRGKGKPESAIVRNCKFMKLHGDYTVSVCEGLSVWW